MVGRTDSVISTFYSLLPWVNSFHRKSQLDWNLKDSKLGDAFKVYHPSFGLRQKMLVLIQNLSYYMMVEVVEPAWHSLVVSLAACTTVDDVLEKHNDFLDNCLHDCLLSSPQVDARYYSCRFGAIPQVDPRYCFCRFGAIPQVESRYCCCRFGAIPTTPVGSEP